MPDAIQCIECHAPLLGDRDSTYPGTAMGNRSHLWSRNDRTVEKVERLATSPHRRSGAPPDWARPAAS